MVTEADPAATRGTRRRVLGAMLALAVVVPLPVPAGTGEAVPSLERGEALYESDAFEAAATVLEQVVEAKPELARAWFLLGKSCGRLAEKASWTRAALLARRCGQALERAVALDPFNREVLDSLARFYELAPGLLGGSEEKAVAIREWLELLNVQ